MKLKKKKKLVLWKESYDKLSLLQSKDITLPTMVCMVKAMFFPVQFWELDHKGGCVLNNWCFQIVVLEITLVPWTARRSNQSILKEINSEYSLEGLMLKIQYFGHLMLEKIEVKRRRGLQRMRSLDSITDSMDMYLIKLQEIVKNREAWHAAVHGVTKNWTQFSDWTTTNHGIPSVGLPRWCSGKEFTCNSEDASSSSRSGRSPGGGNGNPFQYCFLENSTDRGTWWAIVYVVAQSYTTKFTHTNTPTFLL